MKIDDLPFIIDSMVDEMPLLSKDHCSIPMSFSQGLVKDFSKASDKINDKYLNKNQHEIEELNYCLGERGEIKKLLFDFRKYQNKYFESQLNKDSFFKLEDRKLFKEETFIVPNRHSTISGGSSCVAGSEIETGDRTNNTIGNENRNACTRATGFTIGECYDQMALDIKVASGNTIYGLWDDDGIGNSLPKNLLAKTATIASATGYGYNAFTSEAEITTTTSWMGFNQSVTAQDVYRSLAGDAYSNASAYSITFPIMLDPYVNTTYLATTIYTHKVSHS